MLGERSECRGVRARSVRTLGMRVRDAALASLFVCSLAMAGTGNAADGPLDAYARLPAFSDATVSPDGKRIVVLRPLNNTLTPTVIDLENPRITVALRVDPARFRVRWCDWANARRVVCNVLSPFDIPKVYNSGRSQVYHMNRLIAMDPDGQNLVVLGQQLLSEGGSRTLGNLSTGQAFLISLLPDDDDHILVALQRDVEADGPQVVRININTNHMETVRESERFVYQWYADERGGVRTGIGVTKQFAFVIHRALADGGSADVALPLEADEYPYVIAAQASGTAWLPLRRGEDRAGVYEVDLERGSVGRELYRHATYDGFAYAVAAPGAVPIGLRVYEQTPRFVPTNDVGRAIAAELDGALPGRVNIPQTLSASQQQLTLTSSQPHGPVSWYFYDRPAKRLILIGAEYPELANAPRAEISHVTYAARDGLVIPATLMRPPGARGPGPAVVFPHGGPFTRDTGVFDPIAEALVAAGITVLKPEFRGTPGYGYRHQVAGRRQWGTKMQDDVIDGLDWLVQSGHADASRICVVGLSYGGYSALAAAYLTPEKVRCAVSVAGVANLRRLVRDFLYSEVTFFDRARFPLLLGDRDHYDALSPTLHADRFGPPVLLVHGAADRTVPPHHSRDLAEALVRAGKRHRHVELPLSDHSFSVGSERLTMLRSGLEFLRDNLPGVVLPASASAAGAPPAAAPASDRGAAANAAGPATPPG